MTKRFMILPVLLIHMCLILSGVSASEFSKRSSAYLDKAFKGTKGCFILYNLSDEIIYRYNPEKCSKRLTPCSTFKIPNSLIALQLGVHKDENSELIWDGTPQFIKTWERNHTLVSALKESCVWYYQRSAEKIGEENMKRYLKLLDYGNQDISGGLTKFWLQSSLLISPEEQVIFLEKLYRNRLPFDRRVTDTVKRMLVDSEQDGVVISGKTGSGYNFKERRWILGWYVGHMRNGNREYVFATNIEGFDNCSGMTAKKITFEILKTISEAGNPE